jgi:hypothetical protein
VLSDLVSLGIVAGCAFLIVKAFFGGKRGELHHRSGKCVECGYDLRATPERCPECGSVQLELDYDALFTLYPRLAQPPAQRLTLRRPEAGERWVVLRISNHRRELLLIAEHLHAMGIGCMGDGQLEVGQRDLLDGIEASHALLVCSGDVEEAQAAVERLLAPPAQREPAWGG